jgi:hypothetical protein
MKLASYGDILMKSENISKLVGMLDIKPTTQQADLEPSPHATKIDSREMMMFRCQPETRKALKLLAIELDSTVQELVMKQVNKLLSDNGKPGEWK